MVRLKYTIEGTQLTDSVNYVVINLPAGLTVQERKLHRSCLNYTINGGYVKDSQSNCVVTFATAYDNWVTRAALKRGRNHWLEMHREIFKNNPQLKPKWHDYKCALVDRQTFLSTDTGDWPTEWVPEDWVGHTHPHDDRGQTWSVFVTEDGRPPQEALANVSGYGNVVDTDKDEFLSHLVGPHNITTHASGNTSFKSIGLIESWFKSRPDIDPVTTIDAAEMDAIEQDPLNLLFNDGDAHNELIENFQNAVEGDGNAQGDHYPMYANEVINYKDEGDGTYWPRLEEVAATATHAASPISYFTGFDALLGQVCLRISGDFKTDEDLEIVFDVNPRGKSI